MEADALVEAKALTKRFGSYVAVDGIDFAVQPGEAFGFLGPNGAGKTTTMRMIACVSPRTDGRLSVLGLDPQTHAAQIKARIGVVPQLDNLDLELSVWDNLVIYGRYFGLPRADVRARAEELLEFAQLTDRRNDRVDPLSGGMKRRLTIARALINNPELLLLDEPTAGLDPDGRDSMLGLLRALAARHGKSLILSTHLLGDINRVCEQVIIVDRGTVLGVGKISELRAKHQGRYRLRWQGVGTSFLAALSAEGVTVEANGRPDEAVVEVPATWTTRRFFELAGQREVTLRDLSPLEEDLEELYHRVIGRKSRAGT